MRQLDCAVTSTYIVILSPGLRIFDASMLFQRAMSRTDTRKRDAISDSESPRRTV